MIKDNNELNLSIDEKILYKTEPIDGVSNKKNYSLSYSIGTFACVTPFVLAAIALISIFTNNINLTHPLSYGFFLIITFLIILGIFVIFNYFNKKTLFYITNHSIIKLKKHTFKIDRENLSHFWNHYASLLFVSNRKNETSLYNGTESRTKHPSERKTKRIYIPLLGELGEKTKHEMKDIVINAYSMKEHLIS